MIQAIDNVGLFNNPPGLDHISFLVSDADQIYSGLKTDGVVFSNEPAGQDWGARVVSLRDPDGNNLYFCNGSKWLMTLNEHSSIARARLKFGEVMMQVILALVATIGGVLVG